MKINHTSKLFFRKFLYKIELHIPSVCMLRYGNGDIMRTLFESETFEQFNRKVDRLPFFNRKYNNVKTYWENRFRYHKLVKMRQELVDWEMDHQFRFESSKVGIYVNDHNQFERICRIFHDDVIGLSWPKNQNAVRYLRENPTNEIVDSLPHNKFRYKINLRNGKVPTQVKENFSDWIKQYPDMQITDIMAQKIRKGGYSLNGKFIYSTNTENMLLLQMFLGDLIKDVTEYKLTKEI